MYAQAPRFKCAVSTGPIITLPWTPDPICFDGISVNSPWNPYTVSSMHEYTTPSSNQEGFFPGYNLAGGFSQSCTSEANVTAAQPLTTSSYLPATKTSRFSKQSAPRYPQHPQPAPSYTAHPNRLQVTLHTINRLQDTNTPQPTQLHLHQYQVLSQLDTQNPTCNFNFSLNT